MAPLPPLGPTPPEPSGARVLARTSSAVSDEIIRKSDAAAIFVKLRKMIASDSQPTETILGTIAVAAQSLTGATGAALAMPRDGVVVCVGRSGETAPELGDRLDVDSGISGECLRTGVSLRCDDASRDFHVDAEVCREMGLQSIAVVPLRGQYGRVGVLEAFSTAAYAFDEDKMEVLGRLAGLAEAAWARGMVPASPATEQPVIEPVIEEEPVSEVRVTAAPAVEESHQESTVALERVGDAIATGRYRERETERKWRYSALAGLSVVILILLSLIGWRTWYNASIGSRPGRAAASSPQPAPAETTTVTAGAGLAWQPGAERQVSSAKAPPVAHTKPAPAAEVPDTVTRKRASPQVADNSNANGETPNAGARTSDAPADATPGADEVSQVTAAQTGQTELGSVLSTAPSLPKLDRPISQVSGGTLVHKVQPIYSSQARSLHLQGDVVLEATIDEQGQIEDLKVISGHPLLADAAKDAVSQWRYTPFALNGQPIRKETRITISFVSPQ
jgi:periplasmic protein TonB